MARADADAGARRRGGRLAAAAAVLVSLVCAVWLGFTTADYQGTFGPHQAHYAVTTDATVTVSLGPLGTVQMDSPAPLGIGVLVTVEEIPMDLTEVDASRTLRALSGDIESYAQFFTAPQTTVRTVVTGLAIDGAVRSVGAWLTAVAVVAALGVLLGRRRLDELADAFTSSFRAVAGAGMVVLLVVVGATASERQPAVDDAPVASAIFAGTPLEGARVTGRLAGVIDTYGAYVVAVYRQNEAFYDRALGNLEDAMADAPGLVAGDDDTRDPAVVTAVVVADLHCNVGMASLIGRATELSGAQVILNAGDTTMNGTEVESYCVRTFGQAVPGGVTMVVADGNHDSVVTAEQERAAGMTVLTGEVVTVAGIRILGDLDPEAQELPEGGVIETSNELGVRLAEVACADPDGVDILLVHKPPVGNPVLQQGCVPVQISGHTHQRSGPEEVGRGLRYVNSSTAGAVLNRPTVGPLNGTAELTVLTFDTERRRVTTYQVIEVHTDASVTVSSRLPFAAPREAGAGGGAAQIE